jgi:hypothetical protein
VLSFFRFGRRSFVALFDQGVLALAIFSEKDDGRIHHANADGLREAASSYRSGPPSKTPVSKKRSIASSLGRISMPCP